QGDGLLHAESLPSGTMGADPTAPGPWTAAPGLPAGPLGPLLQTSDRALWVATASGDGSTLHRFDGTTWSGPLISLPRVRCLAQDGDDLLIGTLSGLRRVPLHPPEGDPLAPVDEPVGLAPAINSLLRTTNGTWYVGAEDGLSRLLPGDLL